MKLTNAMKDRIIKSIMIDTFSLREATLEKQEKELGDDIWEEFYGPLKKKMAELPEALFSSRSCLSVVFGTERYNRDVRMSSSRLVGACHQYSSFRVPEGSPFIARWLAFSKAQTAFGEDKSTLKRTLQQIISPITTDKRLIDVWPEAERWIPRTPAAMSNLPAVRMEDVNSLILKMKGEEEANNA